MCLILLLCVILMLYSLPILKAPEAAKIGGS
jgi:hypothetical protein